jgi:hypothetical protein
VSFSLLPYSFVCAIIVTHSFFYILKCICINNFFDLVHPGSQRHRSIRQRCLVFETAGAYKNKPIFDCNSNSSVSIQSDCKVASDEKQLLQVNNRRDCSSSVVPGSGLHLNALSAASPNSVTSRPNQNPLDKFLSPNTLKSDLLPCDNEAQVTENAPQTSKCAVGEEFGHGSPKRKRHVQAVLLFEH